MAIISNLANLPQVNNIASNDFTPGAHTKELQESVRRRGIRQLWHVSRLSGLESIFNCGAILSRQSMDALGIPYEMSSWGAYGKDEEMADLICCALVQPWGMSKVEPESKVLIALNARLIWRHGTLFSPDWSSSNRITLSGLKENNTVLAFDAMFDNPTTNFPSPHSVEIIVPTAIPVAEILPTIYFYNDESRDEGVRICGDLSLKNGAKVSDTFRFKTSAYRFRGNG